MDKEHARFVLRSFRPDGADAGDADFAGALRLAAEDRELGEWLAGERSLDAEFSAALGHISIPEDLRDAILAGFAVARGEMPLPEDDLDRSFVSALASISAPANLRQNILAAIAVQEQVTAPAKSRISWFRYGVPLAAAAGIALAFVMDRPTTIHPTSSVAQVSQVPLADVRAGFIRTLSSPAFSLETKDPNHDALFSHLEKRKLPCPGCTCLPKGLKDLPTLGCRELIVDGKRGSMLCFDGGENGVVHLVIFHRSDIADDLPSKGNPRIAQFGEWTGAAWAKGDEAFVLFGKTGPEVISSMF